METKDSGMKTVEPQAPVIPMPDPVAPVADDQEVA
jgi:hypothetical protein